VDAIRDDLDILGEVVGTSSGRVIFAAGDGVSLRLKSSIDPKPGLTLAVVRPEQRVKHPRSHRTMGRVVRAVGTVELREAFGKFWSARVIRSSDAVLVGDLVISVGADEAAEAVSASAEDGGYIVAVPIQKALTGAYEVVFTDLGRNHGVQSGHVFSIIREGTRGRQGGPARKIGEGRVVESRMLISPDGLQISRARAEKGPFNVTQTVTVYPDGHMEKDLPPNRPDLVLFENRLKLPLKIRFRPLDTRSR